MTKLRIMTEKESRNGLFENALNEAENIEVSEVSKEQMLEREKETRWKEKRIGKITSSKLPILMKKGRGNKLWGDGAITYLYELKYQRRTGKELHEVYAKNLEWGNEKENDAIEWLRGKYPEMGIVSCKNAFQDIIFRQPFDGFGDSPDFYGYISGKVIVGEIKCPVSEAVIEKELDDKDIANSDYFFQDMGHLLGTPEAIEIWHVTYDAYNNCGHVLRADRSNFKDQLEIIEKRIKEANNAINKALTSDFLLKNINDEN